MVLTDLSLMEAQEAAMRRLECAAGLVNAAQAELVAATAGVMATGAWDGFATPAHCLRVRAGLGRAEAERTVALAEAGDRLPVCSARFAAGELSAAQMAVLAAQVSPERDAEVAEGAHHMTVDQLRRVLPSIPRAEPDPSAYKPDYELLFGYNDAGDFWLRGLAPTDAGPTIEAALVGARAEIFKDSNPDATDAVAESASRTAGISWLDALLRLCEIGLANVAAGRAEAERTMVLVHIDADEPERAAIHLGPTLNRAQRRLLSCDASVLGVLESAGRPLALLERQRTVDWRLRALVERRDVSCIVAGCGAARWLQIHHIVHWEDGGLSTPANLVALCGRHHTEHHQGLIGISGDASVPGGLAITDRWGRPFGGPAPRPPSAPLDEALRAAGVADPNWVPPSGLPLQPDCHIWTEPPPIPYVDEDEDDLSDWVVG